MPNRIKYTREQRQKVCEMWEEGRGYGSQSKGKNKHGFFTMKQISMETGVKPSAGYMIVRGER